MLTSGTPGVLISDDISDYGSIPAGGTGLGDSFSFTLDPGAACGSSLQFDLDTTSSLGKAVTSFALRVGRPTGPAAPVTLTRTIPGGLSIPDATYAGVIDSFAIDQDLEIADLDFRLDSLTHTWVGDLYVHLKGPSGLGMGLIYRPAKCSLKSATPCSLGTNDGDNFINTRIDDSSVHDLFSAGPKAAPFTGDWLPFANSPSLVYFGGIVTDEQLIHFNGQSTRGTWQVLVNDYKTGDVGTLNSWSLIVTPVAYHCGP